MSDSYPALTFALGELASSAGGRVGADALKDGSDVSDLFSKRT